MKLFSHELKMAFIKRLINTVTPKVLSLTTNVKATTPQSRLILKVWKRLEAVYEKEEKAIAFRDENFKTLLQAAKNALIYICEHDRYYKRWLGLLAFFLTEELNKMKAEFSYEDALNMAVRPLALSFEEYVKHKDALWEVDMCGYLYGLARLNPEDAKKILKAKADKGDVNLPTCNENALIKYVFADPKYPHYTILFRERHPNEFKTH